jgi:transposase
MAMGRRRKRARQEGLWTPTAALPVGAKNQILDEKKFDEYVEGICERFYADEVGRPGLAPGIYFRLLMVGTSKGSTRSEESRGAPAIVC